MTDFEIDTKKYIICCPLCDNEKCVKGTSKCEAEQWAQKQKASNSKGFDPYKSCKGCPNRCAEPNCHNEQTCDGWRFRQEQLRQQKSELKFTRDADNYIKAKAVDNRILYFKSTKKGQKHKR